jgi:hypothetical protein
MSVEVIGNTGSCNRAGTLTFHGMTGDVSVKVTADQQGNFVARITIPKGTFPRAYELELTVDCNGQLQRAQGELTVLNLAPVAADDSANTTPDTPVSIDVTANDSDPDGDDGYPTRVLESSPPTHGTTEVRSDQTVVYTPEKGFVGQDRFQYGVCDDIINAAGSADCGTATVTVRTSPTACVPSPGDTPRLQVAPGKGPGGAKLRITATVDRRLATCPLRLLLGGTPLSPDVPVGSDGSISTERGCQERQAWTQPPQVGDAERPDSGPGTVPGRSTAVALAAQAPSRRRGVAGRCASASRHSQVADLPRRAHPA